MFSLFSLVYHELQFYYDLDHKNDKYLCIYFHKLHVYLINPEEKLEMHSSGVIQVGVSCSPLISNINR